MIWRVWVFLVLISSVWHLFNRSAHSAGPGTWDKGCGMKAGGMETIDFSRFPCPRWHQVGSSWQKSGPSMLQVDSKLAQVSPSRSKLAPSWLKLAPSSPQHGPKQFRSSLLAPGDWFFGRDTQRETAGSRRVAGT